MKSEIIALSAGLLVALVAIFIFNWWRKRDRGYDGERGYKQPRQKVRYEIDYDYD